jgi:glycosyltransferase involved in cell wall biosynthesis
MRVLLLHNRYRAEGGEERAVAELEALLDRRGHEVRRLERRSDDLTRSQAARALLAGGTDPDAVARLVREHRVQVVHAHNLHPLFGWRALQAARRAGARTVLHLHNFRLFCAIGVAFRQSRPCHSCRGRNTLPGLVHRCRGSVPEAAVYAAALHHQQPRLLQYADALAVLSRAHGTVLRDLGVPAGKVHVVPNFIPDAQWQRQTRADRGTYALAAGRLVEEKGFDVAIAAAAAAGVPLKIAGTGPDEPRLRALAAGSATEFLGWVAPRDLEQMRREAAVLLAPSRCEEACPYSVLEALAAGLPVLVSDLGGLPELAPPAGPAPLPPDDHGGWARALRALMSDPDGRRSSGEAALASGRARFSEDPFLERLMPVYEPDGVSPGGDPRAHHVAEQRHP